MMPNPGRLPLRIAEEQALDALLASHDGSASVTRRDAGEQGPLQVQLGERTFLIDEHGAVSADG